MEDVQFEHPIICTCPKIYGLGSRIYLHLSQYLTYVNPESFMAYSSFVVCTKMHSEKYFHRINCQQRLREI